MTTLQHTVFNIHVTRWTQTGGEDVAASGWVVTGGDAVSVVDVWGGGTGLWVGWSEASDSCGEGSTGHTSTMHLNKGFEWECTVVMATQPVNHKLTPAGDLLTRFNSRLWPSSIISVQQIHWDERKQHRKINDGGVMLCPAVTNRNGDVISGHSKNSFWNCKVTNKYCTQQWIIKKQHSQISINFHFRQTTPCWPDVPLYVDTAGDGKLLAKTLIQHAHLCLTEFKACGRSLSSTSAQPKSFFGLKLQLWWFLNRVVYSILMKHGSMKPKKDIWQYHLTKY